MERRARLRPGLRLLLLGLALVVSAGALFAVPADAAPFHGSAGGARLNAGIIDMAAPPDGRGYWLVAEDGGIFTFGALGFHGSTGGIPLNQPVVGMASTRSGNGYWLVASDGGIFAFGDATFHGSTGGMPLNRPIVGMLATPDGSGYWLVASDGGIFAFGSARFYGSTGDIALVSPIVAMTGTPTGSGYWIVAADGGIFAFGDATFHGSLGGVPIDPVVGIATTPAGAGYWIATARGGTVAFGDASTLTSGSGRRPPAPATAITGSGGDGYWIASVDGSVFAFGAEHRAGEDVRPAPAVHRHEDALADDVFDRLNMERRARGLDPLLWDDRLAGLANGWVAEGAGGRWGGDIRSAHRDLGAVLAAPDFSARYRSLGENIARYFGDTGSMHTAWMLSQSHRANVLESGFDSVGIGVACVNGQLWAVVNFGGRRGYNDRGLERPFWEAPNPIVRSDAGAGCR